jgi:catechol-2,3-dioxygenase
LSTRPRLGHVAIQVDDPEAAATFYADLFGFQIVGRSSTPITGSMVLLKRDRADEDQVLQLIEKAAAEHVAFRVETLADLKYWHQEVKRKNIPVVMAANHGTQVGFLIKDSAGRLIEIYWPTGRTDIEASLAPIDLELSDDEILAAVKAIQPR